MTPCQRFGQPRDKPHDTTYRKMCVTDIVIAAQSFVRTEGLLFNRSQRGLVDVASWNVPPGREAGLVESQRPLGVGNNPVIIVDHEVTGGLANVDSMVAVGGMT